MFTAQNRTGLPSPVVKPIPCRLTNPACPAVFSFSDRRSSSASAVNLSVAGSNGKYPSSALPVVSPGFVFPLGTKAERVSRKQSNPAPLSSPSFASSSTSNACGPFASLTFPSETQLAFTNFLIGVSSANANVLSQTRHSSCPKRHLNDPCFQNFRTQRLYSPSAGTSTRYFAKSASGPRFPPAFSQSPLESRCALPSRFLGPKGL